MESTPLSPRAWAPANHRVLTGWLRDLAGRPRPTTPPTAVFDWDNTSIFHDIGEALMRYQLRQLAFRLRPDELARFLPEKVGGARRLAGGVPLAAVRADLLEAYAALWPAIEAGAPERVRGTPAHEDFAARLAWLYQASEATEGIGATWSYPWLAGWVAGHTRAEVQALARAAFAEAAAEPFGRGAWTSGEGRAGRVTFSFHTGIAPQPEVIDLMGALEAAGVTVFVVTASQQDIVRGVAAVMGYPVAEERILGMRLCEEAGRLAPDTLPERSWPATYRAGKRRVIEEHLPAPPVLVAGDSDTDFEMLTGFAQTEVRLLVNRDQPGDIRRLYAEAHREEAAPPPGRVTLLQGRDETAGAFRPSHDTVRLPS